MYLTNFPEHIQANVKFMKNIGTAAKRSPDLNWLNFDILPINTLSKSHHRLGWGSIDADLWFFTYGKDSLLTSQEMSNLSNKFAKCFKFYY